MGDGNGTRNLILKPISLIKHTISGFAPAVGRADVIENNGQDRAGKREA